MRLLDSCVATHCQKHKLEYVKSNLCLSGSVQDTAAVATDWARVIFTSSDCKLHRHPNMLILFPDENLHR